MNEKGRQTKLLAAVAILAMVVCVFAVAMPSVDADTPTEPTINSAVEVSAGSYEALAALTPTGGDAKPYIQDGVMTVPATGMVLTLTGNITAEDLVIVLQGDLKITGDYKLTINHAVSSAEDKFVFNGAQDKKSIVLDGSDLEVTVTCADSAYNSDIHIFNNVAGIYMTGSTLTINQAGTVNGVAWYNTDIDTNPATLVMNNSVFNNYAAGIRNTAMYMTDSEMNVDTPQFSNTIIGTGSTLNNSNIEVINSASSYYDEGSLSTDVNSIPNVYMNGTVSLTGSSVTVNKTDININMGTTVTMDSGSSLVAEHFDKTTNLSSSGDVSISGGKTVGQYINNTYTLDGTTVTGGVAKGATISVGENGVSIANEFTADEGSNFTVTSNANVKVLAGASFSADKATVTQNDWTLVAGDESSTTLPGGNTANIQVVSTNVNVSVGTEQKTYTEADYTPTIDATQDSLEEAIALGITSIDLEDNNVNITKNLVIDTPVAITGSNGSLVLGNDVEISFTNGGSYNGKVTGTDASSGTSNVTVNLSGTFTLKAGSVELIDFNGSNSNTDSITTENGSDFVLTGSLNSKLTVNLGGSGNVTFKGLNITSNGSIYFVENSGYSGIVTSEGTVSVYGKIMASAGSGNTAFDGVSINVQSGATFRAYGGSVLQDTVTVTGEDDKAIINLDGAMHTVTMNDDLNSSNTYGQTQTVVIGSTLDIVSGTKITILGQFVVNKGVTLTIQDGATLEIAGVSSVMDVNGNIIIENGGKLIVSGGEAVDISGNVDIYGEMSVTSGKVTVQENGKVTVAVDGNIVVSAGTTVKSGATVDILGGFDISAIKNEGTINLTGAVKNGASQSNITLGNGGVVNINSYTVSNVASKVVAINDADGNTVTFTVNTEKTGFSGAVISSASEKVDGKDIYTMSVSGSIGAVDDTGVDTSKTYTVDISGSKVVVADSLTVGKNVTVNNSAKLAVSGTITATDGTFTNTGTLDVTGAVTLSGSNTPLNGTVNAAYYSLTPAAGTTATTVYTTFENAVQSGATRVTVGNGNNSVVTVAGDVTVPATVTMVTVNGILYIGAADNRDITVTVSNGSNVTGSTIEVYATLVFENNRNDRTQVNSDVVINADPARTYTNIYTALASGAETVTVARNVTLTSNVEIPAGVTLVVPAGTGLTFNAGVTMTVNGTVQTAVNLTGAAVNGATVAFTDKTATVRDNTAKIVVNGTFMSSVTGKTPAALYQDYRIPGAYYNVSDSTGAYVVVQPVASAAANAANAVGGIIGVYGENTVADIQFTGTEQQTVTVTVAEGSKLTAGTITLSYTTLVATGQIDGTVSTAIGSINVINTTGITVADVFTEVDGTDVESMTVAGTMDKADAEGTNASVTVASGNVEVAGELTSVTTTDEKDVITDNVSLTVASGATLTVKGTVEYTAFTVNGTLVSTDGGNVEVATMYVFGTLTVEDADTEAGTGAGSATIGTLYVGLDNKYDNITAAAVNGAVNVSTLMVVSSSSTVEADLLETFTADTEFNVEGTVWFTAYAKNTSTPVTVDDVAVENADFLGWAEKENGNVLGTTSNNTFTATTTFNVGQYETLYAVIDYNIYTVTVIADNGIGTVAIDGQVLVKNGNQFTISGLKAGTHTIEYSFNSGYGGSPAVTMDGQQLSNSFTLSGTTSADRNVTISIYGSEAVAQEVPATTDSGDDGLTLTDYLLIILVILIVIMAIMVAARLMRS